MALFSIALFHQSKMNVTEPLARPRLRHSSPDPTDPLALQYERPSTTRRVPTVVTTRNRWIVGIPNPHTVTHQMASELLVNRVVKLSGTEAMEKQFS